MRFDIRYQCRFTYDQLVRESQNELRACPASDDHQQLIACRVTTEPSARVLGFTDWFGTRVDAFGVRQPHLVLDVVAEATVETRARPPLTADPRVGLLDDPQLRDEHHEFLEASPHANWDAAVAGEAAQQAELAGDRIVSRLLAVHRHVGARLAYVPGSTYVGVDVGEVLARGSGVCQDFAHLAVAMCRSIGIPARYVSGYLFTVDDSSGDDGAAEVVRVQTHAWFEALVPGYGWFALDPTNGLEVGQRHVKIGHGRDYDDVQPLRGVYTGSASHELRVAVDIRRVTVPSWHSANATDVTPRNGASSGVATRHRAADDRRQQHQAQQ